ncbi:MAG TPA: glycosyltransferase family 2 protein [Opitutaceae bacterium]|nr:glycosyltransferase family 2 protein [Opitutaceae bacterium]
MKLRVITVTRGDSPYWPDASASVAAAVPDAEHVVVCPPAQAGAVARPGGIVLPEVGPGLYPNLNHGLGALPQDWDAFTWLNDDDRLQPEGFAALVAEFRRRADVDVMFGRVALIDGRGGRVGTLPVARRGQDLAALFGRGIIPFAQPGTVIRRSWWERLRRFDPSYGLAADMDFFVRALVGGARFAFFDAEVAEFRLRAGQLSKRTDEAELETARALAPLRGAPGGTGALLRFRLANLPAYAERLRRHGWKSMREIYESVT